MKVSIQFILTTAAVLFLTQTALRASTTGEAAALDAAISKAASESAVYISEARGNLPAPPAVEAYQAEPTFNGFGDDVMKAGVSFPLSFD